MKLQEGVDIYFIPTETFTTNTITVRFAAPMDEKRVAGRVLLANMLELSCQAYPTVQALRRKLADLYGTTLSTSISRRGQVHMLDVTVSYLAPTYVEEERDLTEEVLALLEQVLFHPLVDKKAFDKALFEMEKRNLLSYLEAEKENHFYYADRQLDKLFFTDALQSLSKFATVKLVEKETEASVFEAYRDMLKLDKVDILVLGDVDQSIIENWSQRQFWTYRKPKLEFYYQQETNSVVRERVERKCAQQSVIEMGYGLQESDISVNLPALLVLNSLWGGDLHSRLFRRVREELGLAYSIGTEVDVFSGLIRVYAGIEREQRLFTLKAITAELNYIRKGKITEMELDVAKKSLIHAIQISQDKPSILLEQTYQEKSGFASYLPPNECILAIQAVDKEAVVTLANQLCLQAVYFLEGVGE